MHYLLLKTGAIFLLSVSPVALLAQVAPAPMASGTMEDPGTLRADDSGTSAIYDMTPDGQYFVGVADNETDPEATVWSGSDTTGLGMLGGGTQYAGPYSIGWGISDDGSVVVGESNDANDQYNRPQAVRWVNGVIEDIDTQTSYSAAYGVNGDGSVVVGAFHLGSDWQAFRWVEGVGMTGLGTLASGNAGYSQAWGVSADGSIVVGYSLNDDSYQRAFRWTEADGMVDLGTMRADNSGGGRAMAISADNSTIVGQAATETVHTHAFRWTEAGGMQDLGDLSSDQTEWSTARDVSADGSVVVGAASDDSGNNKAFRWTEETGMQNLGTLRSDNSGISRAWAVSDDGEIVAGSSQDDFGQDRAFIWTAGAMLDHENTLVQVGQNAAEQAAAVTALGQIAEGVLGQEIMEMGAEGGNAVLSSQGRARNPVTLRFSLGASTNDAGDARIAGVTAATAIGNALTLGGYVGLEDYSSDLGGFKTDGAVGAFGVYLRSNAGGTGWTWKLAASHLGGDADITRAATLAATETGTGSADFRARSVLAEVGYGFDRGGMRVTPFGRLSHTKSKRDAYTEASGIAFPVSYGDHEQSWTVLGLGIQMDMPVGEQGQLHLAAGAEFDLNRSQNAVTGTSAIPGMTVFNVASPAIVNDNRAFA
jgi:probable HAF family extracellular repeat protein